MDEDAVDVECTDTEGTQVVVMEKGTATSPTVHVSLCLRETSPEPQQLQVWEIRKYIYCPADPGSAGLEIGGTMS